MAEETRTNGNSDKLRFVDLVLGAWRPREAATQLAAALGIALRPGLDADPERPAITLGRDAIDVAATGDPVAFLVHDDAVRIARALPSAGAIVAVLTPRYTRAVGVLNDWLFFFLRRFGVSLAAIGDMTGSAAFWSHAPASVDAAKAIGSTPPVTNPKYRPPVDRVAPRSPASDSSWRTSAGDHGAFRKSESSSSGRATPGTGATRESHSASM